MSLCNLISRVMSTIITILYLERDILVLLDPASTRGNSADSNPSARTAQKQSSYIVVCICCRGNLFTQLFHSNGCTRQSRIVLIPLLLHAVIT